MSLARLAMAAAGFSEMKTEPTKPEYESAKDDYAGVIVTDGNYRLSVSPRGEAYLPQTRRDGYWHCARPFTTKGKMAFYLQVVEESLWPESILAALADLPDDPADYMASRLSDKDVR